jgi:tRNA 2-selenouridine synthase
MPVRIVNIEEFLKLRKQLQVFDVRSPAEFAYAHIPHAISLPIFNDEQRKEIGTCYKQVGREEAIKIGLSYFGPEMVRFVKQVETILSKYYDERKHTVLLHCWRGGMRSSAMAWLLSFYGFDVHVLEGGYKQYRKWVLDQLNLPYNFRVLGGFTGSGKTEILKLIQQQNIPVIDLEGLAYHKGSAFGNLGMSVQPSQEHFENLLIEALQPYYSISDDNTFIQRDPIWIESESRRIGLINLTEEFYRNLLRAPAVLLDIPFEVRLQYIINDYGNHDKEKLSNAIIRIQKRLGGLETKRALQFLEEENIHACFEILLTYYDKHYKLASAKSNRKSIPLSCPTLDPKTNMYAILNLTIN